MAEPVEIVVRTAPFEDAAVIAMLGTVTFFEAYFEQDDPRDLANYLSENFSREQIEEELSDPGSTFLIAYRTEKAVGYARLLRGSTADGVEHENTIELKRIYVVERYWKTGVGTQLLEECIRIARAEGFDSIWLGVWEQNTRALPFYARHGFKAVGTITFPYGKTVGLNHVMERKLQSS